MPCLETDFLVALLRKEAPAISKLKELSSVGSELSITPITATELFKGAFASRNPENVRKVEQLTLALRILAFDFFAARQAGRLLSELDKNGHKIGDFDALTGAIALRHGVTTIVSKNEKHFGKIEGVKIEKW